MRILSGEMMRLIEKKIICWMRTEGVRVCMRCGSKGFENYVQVNLAGFLQSKFKRYTVRIESYKGLTADILIFDQNNEKKAALAIKVARLGRNDRNGGGINMPGITGKNGDIVKLSGQRFPEKAFLCVVYCYRNSEKSWGDLVGGMKETKYDYRDEIICRIEGVDECSDSLRKKYPTPQVYTFGKRKCIAEWGDDDGWFDLKGCVDSFVF